MIRYFNDAVVLTSQDPQAFLNFVYEGSDPSVYYIIPQQNPNIPISTLFLNGIDVSEDASIYDASLGYALLVENDGDPSIGSFHVFSTDVNDFSYNVTFDVYDNAALGSPAYSVDVSVLNRRSNIASSDINTFETQNVLVDGDTSYLVLRTNPKFTGNIKLIADTSNNLYLDTFKVSDILSNRLYRKQKVSGRSYLSGDIRRVFQDLPLGEMYRLDAEDTLDIALPKTDLFRQYNLNYSYGARLFKDELYDDDYAMLAPLWVNNELPDYFGIFRLDGVINQETYDGSTLADLATKYLENGELIRSYSMKEASPIGNYMRNHLEELLQVRAPVFLSLSDPAASDFDPNTWYGMAIDKGIITGRSEVPFFFDRKAGNFTDMNAFVSEGFERNNLLCPNLINMEYVFSDNDVSLYTMQRYFGLYLTENELYRIAYYADQSTGDVGIISLDGKDSSVFFNSSIFDPSTGDVVEEYQNRIFGLDDILSFNRITNKDHADGTVTENISEWLNKPGENLFTTDTEQKFVNQFITFRINTLLEQGEHLRIIDKTNFKVWEIYGAEWEYLDAGESINYASIYESEGYPTVYRSVFSTKGDINDQIRAIQAAWNVFDDYEDTPFKTEVRKTDSLSLSIKDQYISNDYYFQRITAQILNNPADPSSGFNNGAGYSDLQLYGIIDPTIDDFEVVAYDSSYGPIGFEIYGDRMSLMCNFVDPSNHYIYSIDSSTRDLFEDNVLYQSTDGWYRLLQDFDVSTAQNYQSLFVEDPKEFDDNIIVITEYPVILVNENQFNAYGVYPLSLSLLGINPVKDIDYTVYDSSLGFESQYWYDRSDDVDTTKFVIDASGTSTINISQRNSFEIESGDGTIEIGLESSTYSAGFKFHTFDFEASINATNPTTIVVAPLDGSAQFTSYKNGFSEEDIDDYYEDPSTRDTLEYGLTVPTVAKWGGLGTDCRGNQIRLLLDGSILDDASSNFIPYEDNFSDEISYPVYKYLDPGSEAWKSYVYFDVTDTIVDPSGNSKTVKEYIFENPEIDVFSKLLYTNPGVEGTTTRSSIVYYNDYKKTVDGIITGLNLSLSVNSGARNILDINDWDRYRISFISSPSRNADNNYPFEVIINETTETILLIWYQGNDILNYSLRNSTELPGKNILDTSINTNFRGFVNGDNMYSYVKAPFVVNNSTLSAIVTDIYKYQDTVSEDESSPFVQLNFKKFDDLHSIFNAYGTNFVNISNVFQFSVQYNTFRQYVDYVYTPLLGTFGDNVVNYSWLYNKNENIYTDQTTDIETLSTIFDTNNIAYYILRGDSVLTNDSFTTSPLSIVINDPRSYKALESTDIPNTTEIYTYNGWYRPLFKNILNFNFNEEKEIIDIVEKDFTLGNTNFRSYDDIPQYWFNDVVTTVTATDVSTADAIDYLDVFNVFKAQWDAGYYTLDGTLTDGYNSTLELPSYFGSKLIKLPSQLVLGDWDVTTASSEDGRNWHTLTFNLTRELVNTFKLNTTFIDNWAGLTSSDEVIDGYVKTTILSYYNISKPKILVKLYEKNYDGQRLYFTLDSTFTQNTDINVDGDLTFVNSEYIYNIRVPLRPEKSYYVSFTLTEK